MELMSSIRIATIAVAALLSASVAADRPFSSLEERMTGQEFRQTGLYKLTDEELAALNRWIRQRSLAEGESLGGEAYIGSGEDRRGLREDSSRSAIRSRIVGNFSGWRGQNEFELENGQLWRQATPGSFAVREVENPEVEISPGMFGAWYLSVDGYNSRVRVERIR
jgi:hypothetical protein